MANAGAPTIVAMNDQKPGWRAFLSFVGPGFLISLAYLDPGNLKTVLQAGANHEDELLWVVLIGLIFALIIQLMAANLGVSTGRHLSELCKVEYQPFVKYFLWILAEVVVIAADIPEVIGTAFALNILFHIPVWAGVLLTGCGTLVLLGLQRYGVRKLEMLIATLVFVMAACFFSKLSHVKPPASKVLKGMFIPKLSGKGATGDAIALIGALVMPHNLFLHSALVLSRKVPRSVQGINFSSSATKMGPHKNSIYIMMISWILGAGIIGINIYYLTTAYVDWLIHNSLPKVANVFIGILVFLLMAVYIIAVFYLTFRKDAVVMFTDDLAKHMTSMAVEHGYGDSGKSPGRLPY